jgi:primosomal protein N' (replication factor Y)
VQALIRWDPATHAARELAEREELRFPPAVRMAAVTGPADSAGELRTAVTLPPGAEILGPVPAGRGDHDHDGDAEQGVDLVRYLVRSPWPEGMALAAALRSWLAVRSARKAAGQVRLQIDPAELI